MYSSKTGILRGYLQDKPPRRVTRRASHRQRPPRKLRTHPHAAHDQHFYAGWRKRSGRRHQIRPTRTLLRELRRWPGRYHQRGNFVFSASESYLIEDGKLTRPVRNATLIGNGPEAMKYVSMVGNDLKLDEGIGVSGKEGQSVPVGVGIPTVRIDRMTVGGTA